jgi:hypothetical protein
MPPLLPRETHQLLLQLTSLPGLPVCPLAPHSSPHHPTAPHSCPQLPSTSVPLCPPSPTHLTTCPCPASLQVHQLQRRLQGRLQSHLATSVGSVRQAADLLSGWSGSSEQVAALRSVARELAAQLLGTHDLAWAGAGQEVHQQEVDQLCVQLMQLEQMLAQAMQVGGWASARWVPGGCLVGAWWVPGGCLVGAWWVPGGCLVGAWWVLVMLISNPLSARAAHAMPSRLLTE